MIKKNIFILFLLLIPGLLFLWYYGPTYFLPVPQTPVIRKHAIQMPVGDFFLVKGNNHYAAIRITRLTWTKGAVYECYYQGNVRNNFDLSKITFSQGKVYEKYIALPISAKDNLMKDSGSELNIACGHFKVEWSAYNWIYPRGDEIVQQRIRIAPTTIESINKLNVNDKGLKWVD